MSEPDARAPGGRWFLAGVAVATILLFTVTMRTFTRDADGMVLAFYGFPLAWRWKDLGTSLVYDVDARALAIDALVYGAIVLGALAPFRARVDGWLARYRPALPSLVGLATLLFAAWTTQMLIGFDQFRAPDDWPVTVTRREVVVGLSATFDGDPHDH